MPRKDIYYYPSKNSNANNFFLLFLNKLTAKILNTYLNIGKIILACQKREFARQTGKIIQCPSVVEITV